MPVRTLTEKERRAIQEEGRIGRLFGKPLSAYSSGKSCLSCGVALLWETRKGCPRYCLDCAEEKGYELHTMPRDA